MQRGSLVSRESEGFEWRKTAYMRIKTDMQSGKLKVKTHLETISLNLCPAGGRKQNSSNTDKEEDQTELDKLA